MDEKLMEEQAKVVSKFEKERRKPTVLSHPPVGRRLMATAMMQVLAMASVGEKLAPGLVGIRRPRPEPKPTKTCILPECNAPAPHRGGYCCAEHCKEHKEMQREAKNKKWPNPYIKNVE